MTLQSSNGRVSPVQAMRVTRAGLAMVKSLSWMAEVRHCTDPGSDQERINITFRWVKQHVASCSFLRTGVACCLPTCAWGFSLSDTKLVEKGSFLASPWCLVHLGCASFVSHLLLCTQGLGFKDVPPAGHALWAEFGGGIIFLPLGSLLGSTKICLSDFC